MVPTDSRLMADHYLIRRKFFRIFGGAFHVYDAEGNVVLYSEMKRFRLKEDIRLFTGEDMSREVLIIKARHIFDIATTYDVIDPSTGQAIGALRRKALKSILRDEWVFLAPGDVEMGTVSEDSLVKALLRRFTGGFISMLMPQGYTVEFQGQPVARFKQKINPLVFKLSVDFEPGADSLGFDRRLGLAAAVLFCAVEGRQE